MQRIEMPPLTNQNTAHTQATLNPEQMLARVRKYLDELERVLDNPNPKRSFYKLGIQWSDARIPPELRPRFEELTRRVWSSSGSERSFIEESLLRIYTASAGPAALPLLQDAISFKRARDKFSLDRKRCAMTCIAAVAWQLKDPTALSLLLSLLSHNDVLVRTSAVEFVAMTHVTSNDELTNDGVKALDAVAKNDPAFEPRFRARDLLDAAGHPIRLDPDSVYAFKASLGQASRTIEIKADQTMDALAWAIVGAFGWDNEHLYEFRLSTKVNTNAFKVPRNEETLHLLHLQELFEHFDDETENADDEPEPMTVGFPGFVVGHEFRFVYDCGTSHKFTVSVVEVRNQVERGATYPRVVAKTGEAPPQYREW